jgi:hypothetical protein
MGDVAVVLAELESAQEDVEVQEKRATCHRHVQRK